MSESRSGVRPDPAFAPRHRARFGGQKRIRMGASCVPAGCLSKARTGFVARAVAAAPHVPIRTRFHTGIRAFVAGSAPARVPSELSSRARPRRILRPAKLALRRRSRSVIGFERPAGHGFGVIAAGWQGGAIAIVLKSLGSHAGVGGPIPLRRPTPGGRPEGWYGYSTPRLRSVSPSHSLSCRLRIDTGRDRH
jgi:hypothetical protein